MPDQIKIDEGFITTVRDQLTGIRDQITTIRGGATPGNESKTPGHPLNSMAVVPGAPGFVAGQHVRTKVTAIGGKVDTKLLAYDGKLDTNGQRLDQILASGEHVELTNMSLADYNTYSGATTYPPPTTV
ncbi:hypothetical protein [Actinoplanes sp. NPDC049265]|uniref:hypothetical protein n=1 Tax=Actinoplanes sp. NPDC049265 TaxID=3363902 RepID=UPI00371F9DD3